MDSSLFILAITCYLLSVVATLTASFFSRNISFSFVNTLAVVHLVILITYLITPKAEESLFSPGLSNYLFLSFFCSGILLSGLVLRKQYHWLLKLYFTSFLLSLLVFLFSPSRMLGFIASGQPNSFSPHRIHVTENYYLVGQNMAGKVANQVNSYKLVREMGFFHKTLARDLVLPPYVDSASAIETHPGKEMIVRTYFRVAHETDSLDILIKLTGTRDSSRTITRKIRKTDSVE